MKEIGPRPRKYRMQGSLRINTPIYEKNYGFQFDIAITVAYLYSFSMSAFVALGKAMQSTQACLEREVILDQILYAQSCWTGKKEGSQIRFKG